MDKRLQVIHEVRGGHFFAPLFLGYGRTGRLSYMLTTVSGATAIVDLPAEARSTREIRATSRLRHIAFD